MKWYNNAEDTIFGVALAVLPPAFFPAVKTPPAIRSPALL
jgi:hypothetical protein